MLRKTSSVSKNIPDTVVDHLCDRSGAELVKIASRITDEALARNAIDTVFSMHREFTDKATFPTKTAEDTLLSRIYFEGQREKFAADQAADLDKRLSVYEALHGLDGNISFRQEKQAASSRQEFELLLSCKIASADELVQAGKDFSEQFMGLAIDDRKAFCGNFTKAAEELGVEVPDAIKLFSDSAVEVRPNLPELVLHRKVAMERAGIYDSGYAGLYDGLRSLDLASLKLDELHKIAQTLEFADDAYELHRRKSGRNIPTAWESVLRIKAAEEAPGGATSEQRTDKASLISRYGVGILEEVEDENGNIDEALLKDLMQRLNLSQEK